MKSGRAKPGLALSSYLSSALTCCWRAVRRRTAGEPCARPAGERPVGAANGPRQRPARERRRPAAGKRGQRPARKRQAGGSVRQHPAESGDDVLLEDGVSKLLLESGQPGRVLLEDGSGILLESGDDLLLEGTGQPGPAFVLLESGDAVLLENADHLLLESSVPAIPVNLDFRAAVLITSGLDPISVNPFAAVLVG